MPDRKTIAVSTTMIRHGHRCQRPGLADPEVSDYTYDSDKKAMIYDKDNKVHDVKISLKKNAPAEQESQIWFFTLPKAL